MRIPKTRAISFAPFLKELRRYHFAFLRNDLLSALAIALMTIPQSIAYSLLAGLPPTAGLYSAIFGSILTAGFGSSRTLIAGPSTGTAILIQTSIVDVLYTYFDHLPKAAQDAMALSLLTQMVCLIGLIQVAAAFFNVSKLLQFVGRPVVLGYFGGITLAVVITQMFYFTGIVHPGADAPLFFQIGILFSLLGQFKWTTFIVGFVSLALFVSVRHFLKNWPHALLTLVIGAFLAYGLNHWQIGEPVKVLRDLHLPENPFPSFAIPYFDLKILSKIFPASLAIGMLAVLEVFSISRIFSTKTHQKIQVNQDVFGLSLGNLALSSVVGAMPCSGSVTRTALNYRLEGKTRFAAIYSGVITAALIFFAWPFVAHIPLAALAALLIASVHTLMDRHELRLILRASREDAGVMLFTFGSCLFLRLDIAFFIGIVISIATFLKRSAMPHLVEYAFNSKGRLTIIGSKDEIHHRTIRIIGIGGELYFAAADAFQSTLQSVAKDPSVQAIVLRLNNVHHMDASMCLAILELHEMFQSQNRFLVISGVTEEVWQVFHRAGIVKAIGVDNLFLTDESNPQYSTWKGALRAQDLIYSGSTSKNL